MIDIVFVRYYLDKNDIVKKLNSLEIYFSNKINNIVIINIAEEYLDPELFESKIKLINYSSEFMDVSAYCKGLDFLNDSSAQHIFLFNDTFFTKHPTKFLLSRFSSFGWLESINLPFMLGVVDESKSIFTKQTSLLHGPFVSTFAFIINEKAAKIFSKALFHAENNSPDVTFSAFLDIHLSCNPNPYSWGKNYETDLFKKKRLCVYFERVLSSMIKEENGMLFDVNSSLFSKFKYRLLDKFLR